MARYRTEGAPGMASSSAGVAYGGRSTWTLSLLLCAYLLNMADRQAIAVVLQPIKEAFHASDAAMGLLGGLSFAIFYSILALPMGRFADHTNRRNLVGICCALWSAMTMACGLALNYAWLFVMRGLVAVGEAGGPAPSLSMIADHYAPERRGRAMSVYLVAASLGTVAGLAVGGTIAFHFGWRVMFFCLGAPGIVIAVLLRFTAVEPVRGRWESGPVARGVEPLRTTLRAIKDSRTFLLVALGTTLTTLAGYSYAAWMPTFWIRAHGLTVESSGIGMALFGGPGAIIGTIGGGWLCDALSRRDSRWCARLALISCVFCIPTTLAMYLIPGHLAWTIHGAKVPVAMCFMPLYTIAAMLWIAPVYALVAGLFPAHRRALVIAVLQTVMTLVGAGLGPVLVGILSDHFSSWLGEQSLTGALIVVTDSCYLVGACVFLLEVTRHPRESRSARIAGQTSKRPA